LFKQKARVKWQEVGDLNTRYFHTMLKWRRVKNTIRGLYIDGEWNEELSRVKDEIKNQFRQRLRIK